MTQEPTPHDPFVKTVFADLALAAEELRAVLPPSLVARIDWATLKREPGSSALPSSASSTTLPKHRETPS